METEQCTVNTLNICQTFNPEYNYSYWMWSEICIGTEFWVLFYLHVTLVCNMLSIWRIRFWSADKKNHKKSIKTNYLHCVDSGGEDLEHFCTFIWHRMITFDTFRAISSSLWRRLTSSMPYVKLLVSNLSVGLEIAISAT